MAEESMSQKFELKYIAEKKNDFTEEIRQNELMSKKYKKVCTTVNYIEHFLILASAITGYISISTFVSLVGILLGITSSAVGLKICKITAGLKKSIMQYNSIIKKNKRRKKIK